MDFDTLSVESNIKFNQARRRALLNRWINILRGKKETLLSFEAVRNALELRQARSLGHQAIALDKIVGSVGRFSEFTNDFLPRHDNKTLEGRWRKVYDLANGQQGFPPIKVFKVGPAYFVEDGNHRVSVARMNEAKTIEAYVTDYEVPPDLMAADSLREYLGDGSSAKPKAKPKLKQQYLPG